MDLWEILYVVAAVLALQSCLAYILCILRSLQTTTEVQERMWQEQLREVAQAIR